MNLLGLIPAPYRLLASGMAIATAAAAAWAYVAHLEHQADATGYARGHAEYVELDAAMTSAALRATEASMAETERRAMAQKEIEDAHEVQMQQARADAAIADAAAGRLRQRVEALIAAARGGQGTGNPASVAAGPAASDPAGMLADVLGRCVARVRFLADAADSRGAAGSACEREYDALTIADDVR